MNFLVHGDSPRGAFPLRAWPKYSRLGGQITEGPAPVPELVFGGGIVAGFRRPVEEEPLRGLRDEKDVIEMLMTALESGIIH